MPLEVNKLELKRFGKLILFRTLCLGAHYIAVMDALASLPEYAAILQGPGGSSSVSTGSSNSTNSSVSTTKAVPQTTKKPVARSAKIGLCSTKKMAVNQEELDSLLLNFNMAFFLLLGFYGIAVINYLVAIVVNLRLCLFETERDVDKMGNFLPCTWDKLKSMTFNLATFPCDTAIMSCVVGLYAVKRGSTGLACWQCFKSPVTCRKEEDVDAILLMSSLSLNLNFILVLGIVFYKGFITYYRSTDPEKCECHCEAPRCVTGCFVSLVVTSVFMMPPFLVMKTKYFDLKDIEPDFIADLMDKMMLVGIIIWAVAGFGALVVVPLKMVLMRGEEKK